MATGAYGGSSGIPGNAFAVYGEPPNEDGCPTRRIDESKPPDDDERRGPELPAG